MIVAVALIIAMLLCPAAGAAYDLEAHAAINYGAALESRLDTLRSELGFLDGLNQRLIDRRALDWMAEGGAREDDGLRFLNHFHHPLRAPWRDAGLRDRFAGRSSIIWGQDPAQGFAWVNARRFYLEALTQYASAERERQFGQMFRALGQVMHLVADGSVPAHVRNDAHPLGDPYELWVEEQARPVVTETPEDAWRRFGGRFMPRARRPDAGALLKLQIFGQDAADAGIPIARLWDADRYDGVDGAISRSSIAGITEYANANFFSLDTVFADQRDPGHGRYSPLPGSSEVEQWNDSARQRRYWRRRDRTSDEPEHLAAVSFRQRWLGSTGVPQPPRGRLDAATHDDYARLLLPRAVGYGAEVLDYFFRGKLDVDLVPAPGAAPGGGAVVQLTGTNASEEKLDGGTLELHWERLSTGERFRATVLDTSAAVTSDPGAPVQSAQFEIPAEAERFVAVYKGALGREVPPPDGSAPGAVIGKVFGGERVEEVYAADGRWWLRTPDGIYPLPMLAGSTSGKIQELRWGDADNTLVGRTAFGRWGEPNRFFAWKINRAEGSVAVPRTSTGEVDVQLLDETGFTFGGLVTTVRLSHTVHYRSYQPAYIWTAVYGYLPTGGVITPIREDGVELDNRLMSSGTVQLTDHPFPITLDLAKFRNWGGPSHAWWLERVGYRRDGRIVALVSVWLTSTTLTAPVTIRRYQRPCPTWPCPIEEVSGAMPFRFPDAGNTVLMALIDVKTGEVITEGGQRASTAPEVLTLQHTTNTTSIGGAASRYDPIGFIAVRHEVAQDGERYIVERNSSYAQEFYTYACSPPAATVELGTVDHEYGTIAASSGGAGSGPQAALYPPRIEREQLTERLCVRDMLRWGFNLPPLVITRKTDAYTAFFNNVEDVGRSRSSPERLAILVSRRQGPSQSGFVVQPRDWRLITWDPGTSTATVRDERGAGQALSVSLAGTAWENAVLSTIAYPAYDYQLVVVPLEGTTAPTSAPIASTASSAFTALEPGRVYNTSDSKFYRTRPSFERTALPRSLADGRSPLADASDHHTVILK